MQACMIAAPIVEQAETVEATLLYPLKPPLNNYVLGTQANHKLLYKSLLLLPFPHLHQL